MKILLFLLFFLVTVSFIIPYYLSDNNLKLLNYSSQFVSTLSSLLTLFIAVLLFNKFGIEKSILQKKTDAVIKILEKLNKQSFLMESPRRVLLNFFVTSGDQDVKEYWHMYKDHYLLFGASYIKELYEIQELVENLFIPKEIAKKFEPLRFSYSRPNLKEMEDYLIVTATPKVEAEYPALINDKLITLEDYAQNWKVFIEVMQSWLNKNSSLKTELNVFSC